MWLIGVGMISLVGATGLEDFAHTRFFEAHCATNDRKYLLACWRSWLQNYRAVLKKPVFGSHFGAAETQIQVVLR